MTRQQSPPNVRDVCKAKAYKSLGEEEKCKRLRPTIPLKRKRSVQSYKAYNSLEEKEMYERLQGLQISWRRIGKSMNLTNPENKEPFNFVVKRFH